MSGLIDYVARFFRGYDVVERMVQYEDGSNVLMERNKVSDSGNILATNCRSLTLREDQIVAKNPHLVHRDCMDEEDYLPKHFAHALRSLRESSDSGLE